MPKMNVKIIGDKELAAKLRKMGEAVVAFNRQAATEAAELIHDAAEPGAPGPHIVMEVVKADADQVEVDIGPDKEHWYYQFAETGATAHEITPHKKKQLVFEGAKGLIFTKKVAHPGIPAAPFLRPAMEKKKEEARELAGKVFKAAIERAASGS